MNEFKNIEKLFLFLNENIEKLNEDMSGGSEFSIPAFDLYARDYLKFAENQLFIGTPEALINCVSNLKRAVDCQIDTFFYVLSIKEALTKKNLKFEKKLDLLSAFGVSNSNSLVKLNKIRNKMEHEYSIPEIVELDLYYDLVSAFISNIESAIVILFWDEKNYCIENMDGDIDVRFTLKLERGKDPTIAAVWSEQGNDDEVIEVKFNEYKCFAFYLRCLYLLNIKNAFASNKYVKEQMTSEFFKLNKEFNGTNEKEYDRHNIA